MTLGNDNGTDGQTVRRNMRPPPREEGRIITYKIKPDLSPVNVYNYSYNRLHSQ